MTLDPTPFLTKAVAHTKTAQLRRVTIPPHRREAQVRQTLWGIVAGAVGCGIVWLVGAPMVWYLVALLFGLRIANRDLLLDCLKIAREFIFPGGSSDR